MNAPARHLRPVDTAWQVTDPVLAALREYAVLRALGIPRWRMAGLVMAQSLWVGLAGIGRSSVTPAHEGMAKM